MYKYKISPNIITFLFVIFNYLSSFIFLSFSFKYLGILCFMILSFGIIILILATRSLLKNNTTINPMKPYNTSVLVTDGIYKYSRNPMYLGYFFLLISSGLYFGTWLGLVLPFVYILIVNFIYIKKEENVMRDLFGPDYDLYVQKVGRWI